MGAYDKVLYKGKYISEIDKQILIALDTLMGYEGDLTLTQGGYNRGGVSASAGTHDGGGAFDLTENDAAKKSWVLRLLGVAAYVRYKPTFTSKHVHGIVMGNTSASAGAKSQVNQYLRGTNGLANYGKDTDKRPVDPDIRFVFNGTKQRWTAKKDTKGYSQPNVNSKLVKTSRKKGWNWNSPNVAVVKAGGEEWLVTHSLTFYRKKDFQAYKAVVKPPVAKPVPVKKATIRPVTFNIPDEEKIKGETARAKTATAALKKTNASFIGLNELVGPGKDGPDNAPSKFAKKIASGLGSGYTLIVPTTAYNENYLAIQNKVTSLVKKYDDVKIYAGKAPGKHVTRVVLKDKASGLVYVVGVTHLGSDKEATDAERQAQAVKVMDALKEVSKLHKNAPIIVLGDMNTSADLKGFVSGGLKNVRKAAKKTTNAKYSTYVKISDNSPNTLANWIIDQIYVPKGWTVNGYTVSIEGTTSRFKTPRSSDHLIVLSSVTS